MSRATIGPKILLAATLSLVGGLLISNPALAAIDSTGDTGNQAGQFNQETSQSNWTTASPPAEPKTPQLQQQPRRARLIQRPRSRLLLTVPVRDDENCQVPLRCSNAFKRAAILMKL